MIAKKQITVLAAIFILFTITSNLYVGSELVAESSKLYASQVEEEQRTLLREEMKVIIAAPDQIDIGDEITIAMAGMRDAKAAYIEPQKVSVWLSYFETTDEGTLEEFIIAKNVGFRDGDGNWITSLGNEITDLNGKIFYTKFPALKTEVQLTITVEMDWISPWNELLTSQGQKNIYIGSWRNFEQLLDTDAADVQAQFDNFALGQEKLSSDINELNSYLDDVNQAVEALDNLVNQVGADPSTLHFYLLNISTIVDRRIGSGSYIDNLQYTDISAYNNYISILTEINNAFIDSLGYLDRKGIPYILTMVNYSYTYNNKSLCYDGHLLPSGFNDYNYEFSETYDDLFGLVDADWDNENLNDTSFEYLIEPSNAWSGNPNFLHQDAYILLEGLSAGTYDLWNAPSGYNGSDNGGWLFSNIYLQNLQIYESQWHDTGDDWEIYNGYVVGRAYNEYNMTELGLPENESIALIQSQGYTVDAINGSMIYAYDEFPITVNSDLHTFDIPSVTYNYTVIGVISTPGGSNKPNRAIIVNLMYDLFPYLSRIYAIPRNLLATEAIGLPNYNATLVAEGVNQFYLPPDNSSFIPPPMERLAMHTSPTLVNGVVDDPTILDLDIPIPDDRVGWTFNIADYIYRIASLAEGLPFYINTIAKPLQKFVFDANRSTDSYDDVYDEQNVYDALSVLFQEIYDPVNDPIAPNLHLPIFSLFDAAARITSSQGGAVFPDASRSGEWYVKNVEGQSIEAFFNGTMQLGAPLGSGSNDYIDAYPNSWIFSFYDPYDDSYKNVPSDFQYSPFQNHLSNYAPIGIMISGSMGLIQNSLSNLTMGFGYSFGIIMQIYRMVYEQTYSMYISLISSFSSRANSINLETATQEQLDEYYGYLDTISMLQNDTQVLFNAWDDLDLELIDAMLQKVLDYYSNPANQYTAVNGVSWLSDVTTKALDKADSIQSTSYDMEGTAKFADTETTKLQEDDIQSVGLLNEVQNWINTSIIPLLYSINNTVNKWVRQLAQGFEDFSLSISRGIANASANAIEWVEGTVSDIQGAVQNVGSNISKAFKNLGNGVNTIFNIIAGFTGGIVSALVAKWTIDAIPVGWESGTKMAFVVLAITGAIALGAVTMGALISNTKAIVKFFNDTGNVLSGVVDSVTNAILKGIQGVKTGICTAIRVVGYALERTFMAINRAFQTVQGAFLHMWNVMIKVIQSVITQLTTTLAMISQVFTKIGQVFSRVVNTISSTFSKIQNTLKQVGGFIVNIIGQRFEYLLNIGENVFNQTRDMLADLLNNKAFVKVADTLYPMLQKMKVNSGLVQYATQYGEMTQEIMMKWVDVLQPAAIISAADKGFYIYQMGSEFAEKLFFVTQYRGQLISVENMTVTVQRFVENFEAEFGDQYTGNETSGVIETNLEVLQYVDEETDLPVAGVYYVDFFQGKQFTWFDRNRNETLEPDYDGMTGIAPEGWYMTVVNASYEATEYLEPINAIWSEKTYLFDQRFIRDAFPRIDLLQDDALGEGEYLEARAGGDPIRLDLRILNEMWSQPEVTVVITVATSGGIPITQIEYPKVQLNNEEDGPIAKSLDWNVGRFSPAGIHTMIIAVREYNGDVTFITTQIEIIQENGFLNVVLRWEFWVALIGAFGVAIVGILIYNRYGRKRITPEDIKRFQSEEERVKPKRELTQEELAFLSTLGKPIQLPKDICTFDDAMDGKCGVSINELRKHDFNPEEWDCDIKSFTCWHKEKD